MGWGAKVALKGTLANPKLSKPLGECSDKMTEGPKGASEELLIRSCL